ncbi:hypothetical protein SAMN05660330_03952 [Desulforhopalus singaporensis]|uniref:Uncharacterized protein n=1 Tax=Desulforhopalus singaporensis TaxID=91360 RepID=A0A1H0VA77_9BACT|nr:hypothetical protein SAMN05660330_03952 [Desulforhopalus singaporensis]
MTLSTGKWKSLFTPGGIAESWKNKRCLSRRINSSTRQAPFHDRNMVIPKISKTPYYIGTISLFVSSFQVTTTYHSIMTAPIISRVGP